jgi:oligoendopeptidase F
MDGKTFGAAIAAYEALREITFRIECDAQLYLSTDVSDPARGRFFQDTAERLTVLGGKLFFFTLEINRLEDAALAAKVDGVKSPPLTSRLGCREVRPTVRTVRPSRRYCRRRLRRRALLARDRGRA